MGQRCSRPPQSPEVTVFPADGAWLGIRHCAGQRGLRWPDVHRLFTRSSGPTRGPAILREALSRLLRNATDPDIEARALLSVIERRLGGGGPEMGVARQIIEEAIREETRKRITALGTDGTP